MAIKQADAFRTERRIQGLKIYSDNNDAIISAELSDVELIPYNRLNVANEYLRSVLSFMPVILVAVKGRREDRPVLSVVKYYV